MRTHLAPFPTLIGMLTLCLALILGSTGCGISTPSIPTTPISSVYGDEASLGLPRAPVRPPWGVIFTQYSAPLDYQFSKGGMPTPTSPTMAKGSSKSDFFMFWPLSRLLSLGLGESDFDNAVKNGNISTVHYADYEYMNILFFYTRTRINVYGE